MLTNASITLSLDQHVFDAVAAKAREASDSLGEEVTAENIAATLLSMWAEGGLIEARHASRILQERGLLAPECPGHSSPDDPPGFPTTYCDGCEGVSTNDR